MRLTNFSTIDEIVEVGKTEFKKRCNAQSIKWIPPKQNIYASQCEKYSNMFVDICDLSDKELIDSGLNPSQFIKGAQDFQLAAKYLKKDKHVIIEKFIRLANIGMMLKRHYHNMYSDIIKGGELNYFSDNTIHMLHAALRAYSEALYLDDHTISGEFYSMNDCNEGQIIVRAYKRLSPKGLFNDNHSFNISEIETFCVYMGGEIEIDPLGNLQYTNGICPNIERFACRFKNDKGIIEDVQTAEALQSLLLQIENQLKYVMNCYYQLNDNEKARRLLEIAYYAFQPIKDDWMPDDNDLCLYLNSLGNKVLFDSVSERMPEKNKEFNSDIMKIIDPRCEL